MPKRRYVSGELTPIVNNDMVWFDIPQLKGDPTEVLLNPIVADYIEKLESLIPKETK